MSEALLVGAGGTFVTLPGSCDCRAADVEADVEAGLERRLRLPSVLRDQHADAHCPLEDSPRLYP